jgi:HEAT repeat protein
MIHSAIIINTLQSFALPTQHPSLRLQLWVNPRANALKFRLFTNALKYCISVFYVLFFAFPNPLPLKGSTFSESKIWCKWYKKQMILAYRKLYSPLGLGGLEVSHNFALIESIFNAFALWGNPIHKRSERPSKRSALFILFALLFPFLLLAQSPLSSLPAPSPQAAAQSYTALMASGEAGLLRICEQVRPSGQSEGTAVRYAVALLTHSAKTAADKSLLEKVYLQALNKVSDTEVKAYFMSNLQLIGSSSSVKPLSTYIAHNELYAPAISALVGTGSPEAQASLLAALKTAKPAIQNRLIEALGELKVRSAIPAITPFTSSPDPGLQKQALWALALMGEPNTYNTLWNKAKAAGFKNEATEASNALIEYLHQLQARRNTILASKLSNAILALTTQADQQHYRLAALKGISASNALGAPKILQAELGRFDEQYRREVLKIAATGINNAAVKEQWEGLYTKAKGDTQAEILAMLATNVNSATFAQLRLLPALTGDNPAVRMVAAAFLGKSKNKQHLPNLLDYLLKSPSADELQAAQAALLQLVDKNNCAQVAAKLSAAPPKAQVVLIALLAERRASAHYDAVAAVAQSADTLARNAALKSLSRLATPAKLNNLLELLAKTNQTSAIKALQEAIVTVLDANASNLLYEALQKDKIKILPILAYFDEKSALDKVNASFEQGAGLEKETAFAALCNWANSNAIRSLLTIRQDPAQTSYHTRAFNAIITQINRSTWNDEQRLALLQDLMLSSPSLADQMAVVRSMGRLRGMPALFSVYRLYQNPDLNTTVSRALIQIVLPTADAKPGLNGAFARQALERARQILSGPDHEYERIDIDNYLSTLPMLSMEPNKPYALSEEEKRENYELLFNGKDLNNWLGNKVDYVVDDYNLAIYPTALQNRGNLYTAKEYSDFIFRFEFLLTPGANNGLGIHAPLEGDAAYVGKEIQILDNTAPIYEKLQVYQYHGSVYGVMPAKREFLKPVGEWNQEEVYVKGNYIRVTLNGTVILEGDMKEAAKNGTVDHREHPGLNRNKGHIGFLGHGSVLKFRNIRIKDLGGM